MHVLHQALALIADRLLPPLVNFTGFSGTAQGSFFGQQYVARAEAGYPLVLGAYTLTPLSSLTYSYLRQNGYTKSGGSGAAPNVAYLARPCQFTPMAMNPRCGVPYWTGKRFAPEVVASMPESDNPIDFASRVASIPQLHFSGADDTVVPPAVAQRFVEATGKRCAQARTVPDVTHDGDWRTLWPALLRVTPACAGSSGVAG